MADTKTVQNDHSLELIIAEYLLKIEWCCCKADIPSIEQYYANAAIYSVEDFRKLTEQPKAA